MTDEAKAAEGRSHTATTLLAGLGAAAARVVKLAEENLGKDYHLAYAECPVTLPDGRMAMVRVDLKIARQISTARH